MTIQLTPAAFFFAGLDRGDVCIIGTPFCCCNFMVYTSWGITDITRSNLKLPSHIPYSHDQLLERFLFFESIMAHHVPFSTITVPYIFM